MIVRFVSQNSFLRPTEKKKEGALKKNLAGGLQVMSAARVAQARLRCAALSPRSPARRAWREGPETRNYTVCSHIEIRAHGRPEGSDEKMPGTATKRTATTVLMPGIPLLYSLSSRHVSD